MGVCFVHVEVEVPVGPARAASEQAVGYVGLGLRE